MQLIIRQIHIIFIYQIILMLNIMIELLSVRFSNLRLIYSQTKGLSNDIVS